MAKLSYPGPHCDPSNDPYLWLEEITTDRVLEWVNQQCEYTQSQLTQTPRFAQLYSDAQDILDSHDNIPLVIRRGEHVYNFWRDEQNPRGLWRRTSMASYRSDAPEWEILLDIDQLADDENQNWVYEGVRMLYPEYDRALLSLSIGGSDAKIVREFDIPTRSFVPDGFYIPEAKSSVSWIDKDTIYCCANWGAESLTSAQYPRTVRKWARGSAFDDAELVFTGHDNDILVSGDYDYRSRRTFFHRRIDMYNSEQYVLLSAADRVALDEAGVAMLADRPVRIDLPTSAIVDIHQEWLIVLLRENYTPAATTYLAGSLLAIRWVTFLAGSRDFTLVCVPDDHTAIDRWVWTKNFVIVTVIKDVCTYLRVYDPTDWSYHDITGLPECASADIISTQSEYDDEIFICASSFLVPTTLYYGFAGNALGNSTGSALENSTGSALENSTGNALGNSGGSALGNSTVVEPIKSSPQFFNTAGLMVQQYYATSDDGTKIPYFLIGDGDEQPRPTLLYGYGGFEVPLTPFYSGVIGKNWLERGGRYVVANIRGGGEYGPTWHSNVLRENRVLCYEDFSSVATDLINRGITTSELLGAQGGSNGGLLMGVMYTQYPQLFAAIVCMVPLLDMYRYAELLAGPAWIAEYGDPRDPAQWDFIAKYSPYHNLRHNLGHNLNVEDPRYPPILIYTSTKDDRVHPGHARKFFARAQEYGYPCLYYENTDGGHAGSANNNSKAYMYALIYEFLWQKLTQ